jgi:hypothetical protein
MDCNRVTVTVRCRDRTSLSSDSQAEIGSPLGVQDTCPLICITLKV